MGQTLQEDRPDDGIAVLRLDRPKARNAMDRRMLTELLEALDRLAADDGLRALVFSTTDVTALCAGADTREPLTKEQGVERMEAFARLYAAVEAFPAPTIAVLVGNCVGAGAELATGCDLRVGGDNLKLAWPGGRLGVPVGPARLVPLVGLARAKELVFSGRVLGMDDARELGLLARCAPAAEAEDAAVDLARGMAQFPAEGLRRMKGLFRDYEGTAYRVARENAILVDWQTHGAGLPQGASPTT
ncbi:enoyl-CoA hydratase/isomerase family protein [Conexibacter sp. SYSU D00693]|uniref:enoyl-CoA hydratase/isomerase family protein n=1 Tax=Conexibacter sp. SYSU D00693 TaxID=2812560 RepID=UPI00196BA716|nr:enoyl-CoA hydratase/isomerase family protein [Conexibacter sp. SYSU D00693]